MKKRIDYSGAFEPELTHDTFSSETLFKLLHVYAAHMIRIDGLWYGSVMSKYGNEVALNYDINIMKKARVMEIEAISSVMNIKGNDVATMMKVIQLSPWVRTLEYQMDVRNNNYATYLIRTCPTLFTLEKEGKGRGREICLDVCMLGMRIAADCFNRDIKIEALKLPPRESEKDICCHWKYYVEK
jgi:hypothetical protein